MYNACDRAAPFGSKREKRDRLELYCLTQTQHGHGNRPIKVCDVGLQLAPQPNQGCLSCHRLLQPQVHHARGYQSRQGSRWEPRYVRAPTQSLGCISSMGSTQPSDRHSVKCGEMYSFGYTLCLLDIIREGGEVTESGVIISRDQFRSDS